MEVFGARLLCHPRLECQRAQVKVSGTFYVNAKGASVNE